MFSPQTLQRFETEIIMWMATVTPDGQPQTTPVWFLWDGQVFWVFSLDPTPRLSNIEANPSVSLNLEGNGTGGAVVTIEGIAEIDRSAPKADEVPEYVDRYRDRMSKGWGGPAEFAAKYPTPIKITPSRVRQWGGSR